MLDPHLDSGTLTQLGVLIAALVQAVKGFVPDGPKQNQILRGISIMLGVVIVPAVTITRHGVAADSQLLVDAVITGLSLGAGVTLAAAAAIATNKDRPPDPPPPHA